MKYYVDISVSEMIFCDDVNSKYCGYDYKAGFK